MDRAGQTQGVLLGLIVAALSIGVMIAIFNLFLTGIQSFVPDESCRLSVLARGTGLTDLVGDTPILCSSENVGELKGEREEIKRQIADMAASCWRMYGEGQIDNIWNENDRMCGTCYTFSVPNEMDLGNESGKVYVEEAERSPDYLLGSELTNYFASNVYDVGLIYGGSSYNYFSDYHRIDGYEFVGVQDDSVRINFLGESDVNFPPYVIDKTSIDGGFFEEETLSDISDFGNKLRQFGVANFMVIVADEFDSDRQTRFNSFAENFGLSDDVARKSAIFALERSTGKVILHFGIELERHILEGEINDLLRRFFSGGLASGSNPNEKFNSDFSSLISHLESDIFELNDLDVGENIEISLNSYLSYLTNSGGTFLPISEELEAGTTYTVTFVHDDRQNFNTLENRIISGAITGASSAVAIAVMCVAGGVATGGVIAFLCGAGASAAAVAGYGAGTGLPSVTEGVVDLVDSTRGDKVSLITIADLNTVGGECNYE